MIVKPIDTYGRYLHTLNEFLKLFKEAVFDGRAILLHSAHVEKWYEFLKGILKENKELRKEVEVLTKQNAELRIELESLEAVQQVSPQAVAHRN